MFNKSERCDFGMFPMGSESILTVPDELNVVLVDLRKEGLLESPRKILIVAYLRGTADVV